MFLTIETPPPRNLFMNGLRTRISQASGTGGCATSSQLGMVYALMLPRRYGGTETGIGDDTKPSRDLVCESFEEILGIDPIFAEGCAPCVHIVGISSGFIVR